MRDLPKRIDVYRVLGLLGRGGMGEVYRAFDEDLEREVALKRIRADRGGSAKSLQRFRREAKILARLKHPAIVQIYRTLLDEDDLFLVMELAEGQSLSQVLRESGALQIDKAIHLIRQVADALAFAHRQGVIHRDLKAENIMLSDSGQAKLLDFGLAKGGLDESSLSSAEGLRGTLYTMAPEQTRGQADRRSDLFSLGAVFYQVLSGDAPFRGKTPEETLAKILTHRPASLAEEIPRRISELVDRLLEKDPSYRPQSAAEVVATLDAMGSSPEIDAVRSAPSDRTTLDAPIPVDADDREPRRWRGLSNVVLAMLCVLAIFVGWLVAQHVWSSAPTIAVVVLPGVDDLQSTWLAIAAAEICEVVLSADGRRGAELRRVAPGDDAFRDTHSGRSLDAETLGRLRQSFGLGEVLLVGFVDRKAWLRLLDLRSGERLEELSLPLDTSLDEVADACAGLRPHLGLNALRPEQVDETAAVFPAGGAMVTYFQGLSHQRWGQLSRAVELLEQATKTSGNHPAPRIAQIRAQSLHALRDLDDQAGQVLGDASFTRWPLRPKLWNQGELTVALYDWPEAAKAFSALHAELPEHLGIGLRLVEAQVGSGEVEAALDRLSALRDVARTETDGGRIDRWEAEAHLIQGDLELALSFAEQAVEKLDGTLLAFDAATALLTLGTVQQARRELEAAERTFEKAAEVFVATSSQSGFLTAYHQLAALYVAAEKPIEARNLFEELFELCRKDGRCEADLRVNLGATLVDLGKLGEGIVHLQTASQVFESLGDQRSEANARLSLGTGLQLAGDLAEAEEQYSNTLAIYRGLEDELGEAFCHTNLGELAYLGGELDLAYGSHRRAREINGKLDDLQGIAYDEVRLGMVEHARGNLDLARQHYLAALELTTDDDGQEIRVLEVEAAMAHFELARLDLTEGRLASAQNMSEEARRIFLGLEYFDELATTKIILAEIFLAEPEPRLDEARVLADQVRTRRKASQNVRLGFAIDILEARFAANSEPVRALELLEDVARRATESGHVIDALQANQVAEEIAERHGLPKPRH